MRPSSGENGASGAGRVELVDALGSSDIGRSDSKDGLHLFSGTTKEDQEVRPFRHRVRVEDLLRSISLGRQERK